MSGRRPKYKKPALNAGKKVYIYIHADKLKLWRSIENRSAFVDVCLNDPAGIMTWAILHHRDPKHYSKKDKPIEEVLPVFNEAFPLDPLTKARLDKQKGIDSSQTNYQNNPALS